MHYAQTPFLSFFSSLSGALDEPSSAPRDLLTMPQPLASSSRLATPPHTPPYYLASAEAGASNGTTPVSSSSPHTPAHDNYSQLYEHDFHSPPSPEQMPAAAAAAVSKDCGVPIITGNTYLDSLLIERYFPASTYNDRTHTLEKISHFHEIPDRDVGREDLRIPNWLRNILGQGILHLFRATGAFRGDFEHGKSVRTFVPYLYLRSAQGNEFLRMSWEVLARIEMSGDGQLNKGDTLVSTAFNGATVSLLSREHFREIALSDPESVINRTAFVPPSPNPPFVTGGIPPYLMKAPVPDSKTQANITNDMNAWFKKMVDYLDDELTRVINVAQAIHETGVKLAAAMTINRLTQYL